MTLFTQSAMDNTIATSADAAAATVSVATNGESSLVKTATIVEQDRVSRVELAQQAAYARLLGRLVLVNMPIHGKGEFIFIMGILFDL